jgi:hypothetical protein
MTRQAATAVTITDDSLTGVCGWIIKFPIMLPGTILDDLSPYLRVTTAVAPFLMAIGLRLLLGGNALTRWLMTLSVAWFAANILMAPYSARMRQDIQGLRFVFR